MGDSAGKVVARTLSAARWKLDAPRDTARRWSYLVGGPPGQSDSLKQFILSIIQIQQVKGGVDPVSANPYY
jgi:hypothetical protein